METDGLAVVLYRTGGLLPSNTITTIVGVFDNEDEAVQECSTPNHYIQYLEKGVRLSDRYPSLVWCPKTEKITDAETRRDTQIELIDMALVNDRQGRAVSNIID